MDLSVHDPLNEVQLEEICSIESHVCCKCTGVFGTEEELKVHKETEHVPEEVPDVVGEAICDECDFKAKDEDEHVFHIKSHETNVPQIYNCGK